MDLETFIILYEPFVSSDTGRIYLRLHFEGEFGEDVTEEVLLTDKRALRVIKYEQAKMLGRLPKQAETTDFLEVLAGAAEMSARRKTMDLEPAESGQAEEEPPVLGKVVERIAKAGGLKADNGHLLAHVTHVATKMGILGDDPKFPKTVDQLGSQFARLKPLVAKRNIALDREDKDRPREWTIDMMRPR